MQDGDGLIPELSALDISNVFMYVGDAVRWDMVHGSIARDASTLRAVAASTWSPSSFASLVSGRYTPAHGVGSFEERLPSTVPTLFDGEWDTRFCNSIFEFAARIHGQERDPIYSVLGVEPPEHDTPFEGLSTPFVSIERGPGGHAPWGDFDGPATEYFERRAGASRQQLREEYERSVELDAELFASRLAELDDRGLRDDTLVIFTSDHGELLGEHGLLGHSGPMHPKTVRVPLVFDHPDLSERVVTDATPHHADIAPTVRTLLGGNTDETGDGVDLTTELPTAPRPTDFENRFLPDRIPVLSGQLHYQGLWDADGGHVLARHSRSTALSVYGAKLLKSSKRAYMRRHVPASLRFYATGDTTYGSPSISRADAAALLSDLPQSPDRREAADISGTREQQLQDLGYM